MQLLNNGDIDYTKKGEKQNLSRVTKQDETFW